MSKFPMDEKAVRALAAILEETGLTEIEVEVEQHRIRVAKAAPVVSASLPMPVAAAGAAAAAQSASSAAAEVVAPAASVEGVVASPMVGTAYIAPEPGAPPFVKVGDQVREGQTLVIIEAMKVMNALPAPRSGTVREVLVRDGQPVEFGEPLMIVN